MVIIGKTAQSYNQYLSWLNRKSVISVICVTASEGNALLWWDMPTEMCRMYNYSTSVQVSLVSFIFFADILLHCKDKYQNNVISVINVMILLFMRVFRWHCWSWVCHLSDRQSIGPVFFKNFKNFKKISHNIYRTSLTTGWLFFLRGWYLC